MLFQEFLDLYRGHATAACCRDCLAIAPILDIAAGENTVNLGENVIMRLEIAVGVGVELVGKHFGVRFMANAEE
jgi:hypothetical protein